MEPTITKPAVFPYDEEKVQATLRLINEVMPYVYAYDLTFALGLANIEDDDPRVPLLVANLHDRLMQSMELSDLFMKIVRDAVYEAEEEDDGQVIL
jgi:hypothetical protein